MAKQIENNTNQENIINPFKYILITDNKGNKEFCLANNKKQRIGRKNLDLTFFENKKLNSFWEIVENEEIEYDNEKIINSNNKEIYKDEITQKLSVEEIGKLKEQGITGDELIKIIMDSNESTKKRTLLSQEKIMKKKDKIHTFKIWIQPTNLFNVMQTFFEQDLKRINFLRFDTLSTMLIYTNFYNNASSLIYEETEGLVTSAYAMRSGNNSSVTSLFDARPKVRNNLLLNLPYEQKNIITYAEKSLFCDKNHPLNNFTRKNNYLFFSNLVICLKDDQEVIKNVMSLYDYLSYSGMLIIFSRNIEVLLELDKIFFENKWAIDCRIHETHLREYQVLPLRTHPMMNSKGYSGYVFTAIKIVDPEEN